MNETLTKDGPIPIGFLMLVKGQGPIREDVRIVCAETSQRYMSRDEAIKEAQDRIKLKVQEECGPKQSIDWNIENSK